MSTTLRKFGWLLLLAVSIGFLQSCKNKDPSVLKVYVKSYANAPVAGAKVVIIGDVTSDPATFAYVDTVVTNQTGFATFDLASHYALGGKKYEVAYFDIIAKAGTQNGSGYSRTRIHNTAVQTVYIN